MLSLACPALVRLPSPLPFRAKRVLQAEAAHPFSTPGTARCTKMMGAPTHAHTLLHRFQVPFCSASDMIGTPPPHPQVRTGATRHGHESITSPVLTQTPPTGLVGKHAWVPLHTLALPSQPGGQYWGLPTDPACRCAHACKRAATSSALCADPRLRTCATGSGSTFKGRSVSASSTAILCRSPKLRLQQHGWAARVGSRGRGGCAGGLRRGSEVVLHAWATRMGSMQGQDPWVGQGGPCAWKSTGCVP